MVIVKLSGGLGNQMFQYAFGKCLAVKNELPLKLDLSFYESQDLRKYELDRLNINAEIATSAEVSSFMMTETTSIVGKIGNKINNLFRPKSIVREKKYSFDPAMLEINSDVYLDGYWQSEKYFKSIEMLIRNSFTFKIPPSKTDQLIIDKMHETNSISIHIRRGDYISVESTNKVHGICDLSYYDAAVEWMSKKITNPVFFIFSDDLVWVKQNLAIPFEHVFVNNNEHSADDLRLMSTCKHQIIANSTFSWWAAWLNQNENKRVVAPKQWFADASKDSSGLIPEAWIRL